MDSCYSSSNISAYCCFIRLFNASMGYSLLAQQRKCQSYKLRGYSCTYPHSASFSSHSAQNSS